MKPIRLEMQAFGSFKDNVVIDFEKLSQNGPFVICGSTGSGKTTILDAICFALYGKGSGEHRTSLQDMRCKNVPFDKKNPTLVRFTFEHNQVTYEFTRKLECKVKNFEQSYNLEVIEAGQRRSFLNENAKEKGINEAAKEILGLSYEQFRQVVILPQGKFEEFLVADPEVKEQLLKTIFDTEDKWQTIADCYCELAQEKVDYIKGLEQDIKTTLANEHLNSIEEMGPAIEQKRNAWEAAEAEAKSMEESDEAVSVKEKLELCGKFEKLDLLIQEKSRLDIESSTKITGYIKEYESATRAENVRQALGAFTDAEKAVKECAVVCTMKQNDWTNAVKALNNTAEKQKILEKRRPEYESALSRLQLFSEKKKIYEALPDALIVLKNKDRIYSTAIAQKNLRRKILVSTEMDCRDAYDHLKDERNRYAHCQEIYMLGICGTLAGRLEEGTPCPVCGSLTHPFPASKHEDSVSEEELTELKHLQDEAEMAWESKNKKYSEAKENDKSAGEALIMAEAEKKLAENNLNLIRENLIDGIATGADLKEENARLEKIKDAFETDEKVLSGKLAKDSENAAGKEGEKTAAEESLGKAEEKRNTREAELKLVMEENGFREIADVRSALKDERERQELGNLIQDFRTRKNRNQADIAEAEKSTEGKERPDKDELQAEQQRIHDRLIELKSFAQTSKEQSERLQSLFDRLLNQSREIKDKKIGYEDNLHFAKRLKGDTGTSLQRYVLSVQFKPVVVAANKMLEKVHNGRYQLFITNDRGTGKKKGLELSVHDSWEPEGGDRSVRSLSGGEKFLVSLALSIGLSETARMKGTKLGALFIDEGFGSLDDDSVDDALDILRAVTASSSTVGIISHVAVVTENIPTKLMVEKATRETGSKLRIIYG